MTDVNVNQINGATIACSAGSFTSNTPRVVIATDQPKLDVRVTNPVLPNLPVWSLQAVSDIGPGDSVDYDGTFSLWAAQVVLGETTEAEIVIERTLDGVNWYPVSGTLTQDGVYEFGAIAYGVRANVLSVGGLDISVSVIIAAAQA